MAVAHTAVVERTGEYGMAGERIAGVAGTASRQGAVRIHGIARGVGHTQPAAEAVDSLGVSAGIIVGDEAEVAPDPTVGICSAVAGGSIVGIVKRRGMNLVVDEQTKPVEGSAEGNRRYVPSA